MSADVVRQLRNLRDSALDRLFANYAKFAHQEIDAAHSAQAHVRMVILTLMVIGMVIGIVVALALARSVAGNIRKVARSADAVAGGDLEQRAEVRTTDETRLLADAVNAIAPVSQHPNEMPTDEAIGAGNPHAHACAL